MRYFSLGLAIAIAALSALCLIGMVDQLAIGPAAHVDPTQYRVAMGAGFFGAVVGLIEAALLVVLAFTPKGAR